MSERKSLLREAYAACSRHADAKHKAEGVVLGMQVERAGLQYDLADALGMITKHDDVPSFESMLTRIRELRLTLKRREVAP
ncbi:hypothetical protein AA103196_0999 [Ameyamaea chiangmaiensis NBRC 103196]|uniref:Uncharacterized protein n=1 Tax=Ameyamaea chiangmaiensis TaxID=442969 RepID=A0A850PA06_9PROT|nr:hypothetical protein [Ameyamaea chiangmaiensis]MBS4074625.1 hypothetical protein [Ameyamaea chiangmaiensis]NVN39380.1 hypothetical protein [Ameyamaea chiangmaiensis]GBQ64893.1 hypothetical protein AA103196_0999 [Ameyamaea chiangmaiensis NBRC 103196]